MVTVTGGHFREVCKHGFVGAQCRCPGPKADRVVECRKTVCKQLDAIEEMLDVDGSVYLDDHTIVDGLVDVRDARWVRVENATIRGDGSTLGRRMSIPVERVLRVEWK